MRFFSVCEARRRDTQTAYPLVAVVLRSSAIRLAVYLLQTRRPQTISAAGGHSTAATLAMT